jgi:transposase
VAITQIAHDTPGRAYYQRKRAAGKSHREALRCLKRQLSNAVYRRLVRDAHPDTETPRKDTRGRLPTPARPAQPLPPTLRTSHFPARRHRHYQPDKINLTQRGAVEITAIGDPGGSA